MGIRYREDEEALDIGRWCAHGGVAPRRQRLLALVLEPGRAIVGNAGVLLSRVEYLKLDKGKRFAIVDASMSELIRPALYEAWHEIIPLAALDRAAATYDVVGPVCESSDVLGTDRSLAIAPGDGIAILSAGAYGMVMSSNYNSRPRPCEVMVDGATRRGGAPARDARLALRRRDARSTERAPPRTRGNSGPDGIDSIPCEREFDQIVALDTPRNRGCADFFAYDPLTKLVRRDDAKASRGTGKEPPGFTVRSRNPSAW